MVEIVDVFRDFNNKSKDEQNEIISNYIIRSRGRPIKKHNWEELFNNPQFLKDRKLFSVPVKKAFSTVRKPELLTLLKNKLTVDPSLHQALSGMMAGDLGMRKSGNNWGFKICQAHNKHKAYVFSIYNQLFYFSLTTPQPYLRKNSLEWQWDTITSPNFAKFHDDWYIFDSSSNKYKKIVPKNFTTEYLSDRALAYWYMDDGYLLDSKGIGKAVALSTHGFEESDVQALSDGLNQKYNWKSRLGTNKGKKVIIIPGEHDQDFLNRVKPHIHQSMTYKLPTQRKPRKPAA